MEYETVSGDTFDSIAKQFFDDEKLAIHVIKANVAYASVLIFGAGTILKIPDIEVAPSINLPPWKRGDS
ncbi:tail protein X [Gracilibacillus xinjiangensis]|uniref:Tail protein X n=1 Tax=Gracilibacillus xinjiangensis TaxID=1193282 RepID=A0ABV8WW11_9BACI